jgi:hypothetical protein
VFGSCSPDHHGGDIDVEHSRDLVQHLLGDDHWAVATNADKQSTSKSSLRLVNGARTVNDAERLAPSSETEEGASGSSAIPG